MTVQGAVYMDLVGLKASSMLASSELFGMADAFHSRLLYISRQRELQTDD